jgi:hypothetical protein
MLMSETNSNPPLAFGKRKLVEHYGAVLLRLGLALSAGILARISSHSGAPPGLAV